MTKQTITTEIDVPEGYEFVRIGTELFNSEMVKNSSGILSQRDIYQFERPIYRKAWQWPKWLKAPWIAMDKTGDWHTYTEEPQHNEVAGFSGGFFCYVDCTAFDWTPPPCDDWKQSKRKNPNLESNDE